MRDMSAVQCLARAAVAAHASSSWVDTTIKVVPIAAITSVLLAPLFAVLTAERQERGKRRAADRQVLQQTVREFQSHLAHHRARARTRQRYDPDFLPDPRIEEFVEDVVNASLSQPRWRQRRIRKCLVAVAGDLRVRMAEDIGLSNAKLRSSREVEGVTARQDARLGWYTENYLIPGVADTSGLLARLAQRPQLSELHGKTEEAVRKLLRVAGVARTGLAGRRPIPSADDLPDPPSFPAGVTSRS
jgi:hypothetical protein